MRVMYTVTPQYCSNSALQYCATLKFIFFSYTEPRVAPESLPPCPGSRTTTILLLLARLAFVFFFGAASVDATASFISACTSFLSTVPSDSTSTFAIASSSIVCPFTTLNDAAISTSSKAKYFSSFPTKYSTPLILYVPASDAIKSFVNTMDSSFLFDSFKVSLLPCSFSYTRTIF